MIFPQAILNWASEHPWPSKASVEQDLIICRAIVEIYSDPFLANELAWRGGTALHKLYLSPQVRYSEDIDLVQIHAGPIKPIVERLDEVLAWLPGKRFDLRRFGFRMRFRFDSEIPPVEQMGLKVEVNTFEHFSVQGLNRVRFSVDNAWFSGSCMATTYGLNELLATKFRAMYQRKKLRDLFDMDYALRYADVDISLLIECWKGYMSCRGGNVPSRAELVRNMDLKMSDHEYLNDMQGILRPGVSFDPQSAYRKIKELLIDMVEPDERTLTAWGQTPETPR